MKPLLKTATVLLALASFAVTSLNATRGDLSQPPNKKERAAFAEIGCPIAISGISAECEPNFGGIDVAVTWRNMSDKDIKYAYMIIGFQNNVGDWIEGEIRGEVHAGIKIIGPIKARKTSWGIFNSFKNVMYTTVAKKVFIKGVQVEYMDGTMSEWYETLNLPGTTSKVQWKRH